MPPPAALTRAILRAYGWGLVLLSGAGLAGALGAFVPLLARATRTTAVGFAALGAVGAFGAHQATVGAPRSLVGALCSVAAPAALLGALAYARRADAAGAAPLGAAAFALAPLAAFLFYVYASTLAGARGALGALKSGTALACGLLALALAAWMVSAPAGCALLLNLSGGDAPGALAAAALAALGAIAVHNALLDAKAAQATFCAAATAAAVSALGAAAGRAPWAHAAAAAAVAAAAAAERQLVAGTDKALKRKSHAAT